MSLFPSFARSLLRSYAKRHVSTDHGYAEAPKMAVSVATPGSFCYVSFPHVHLHTLDSTNTSWLSSSSLSSVSSSSFLSSFFLSTLWPLVYSPRLVVVVRFPRFFRQ